MTPDEHDNRILAKCREIIALGEKRTQGEETNHLAWSIREFARTHAGNWDALFVHAQDAITAATAERDKTIAELTRERDEAQSEASENAANLAALAEVARLRAVS